MKSDIDTVGEEIEETSTTMGYDIHITRKEFWADEDGPEISFDEWRDYLTTDPTIESDPENPGEENYILTS